jgi:hypothetical protein
MPGWWLELSFDVDEPAGKERAHQRQEDVVRKLARRHTAIL